MDIASAKQQIKNTVQIYLQKDALGRYRLPLVHQRPIFLLGAPGLGKTAIMQQVADEMGLGVRFGTIKRAFCWVWAIPYRPLSARWRWPLPLARCWA